jgi:hypothetical protein
VVFASSNASLETYRCPIVNAVGFPVLDLLSLGTGFGSVSVSGESGAERSGWGCHFVSASGSEESATATATAESATALLLAESRTGKVQ